MLILDLDNLTNTLYLQVFFTWYFSTNALFAGMIRARKSGPLGGPQDGTGGAGRDRAWLIDSAPARLLRDVSLAERTTLYSGKARRTAAKQVIDSLGGLRFVREALTKAPRGSKDAAGRQWPIGPHVAEMATRLLSWEGSGELPDFWVHKIREDWYDADAHLTERGLRTARRVGVGEHLWEERAGTRPSDGARTTLYRLDLVRVGLVAVTSAKASTERLIEREGRAWNLAEYEERLRELERAEAILRSLGEANAQLMVDRMADYPKKRERHARGANLVTLPPLQEKGSAPQGGPPDAPRPEGPSSQNLGEQLLGDKHPPKASPSEGACPAIEGSGAALDRSAVSDGYAAKGVTSVAVSKRQDLDDDPSAFSEFLDDIFPIGRSIETHRVGGTREKKETRREAPATEGWGSPGYASEAPRNLVNKWRLEGVIGAAAISAGGDLLAEEGERLGPEEKLHVRLVALLRDGDGEVGRLVERHLRGEEVVLDRIAAEAREVLKWDAPAQHVLGAVEFHVTGMRKERAA